MKILIADDVKMSLEIEKAFLKDTGCELISALNGREGLETARKERPDLVMTDLHMPEMDGAELCQAIKNDPAMSSIPVIILTSDSNPENLEKCHNARCDGILKKPFTKGAIIETVRKYVKILCREHKRAEVGFDVFYNFDEESSSALVTDISSGGMFVRTDSPLSIDAKTEFSLIVGDSPEPFNVEGKIVRTIRPGRSDSYDEQPGMGIKFRNTPGELLEIIDKLVNK
ncbi:MAG: response regulator [bacterium]|nr:response regulator [bacterium]